MATIIAPNRGYTGVQGNIEFAGGVASFVQFESDEKEALVTAILEKRGFTVITDEEYVKSQTKASKDQLKAGTNVTPITADDILPPVEDGDDDELGNDDDDVDGEANEGKPRGNSNRVIKRNKGKNSK